MNVSHSPSTPVLPATPQGSPHQDPNWARRAQGSRSEDRRVHVEYREVNDRAVGVLLGQGLRTVWVWEGHPSENEAE